MSILNKKINVVSKRYLDTLEPAVKARYLEKLNLVAGKDPYEISKREWSNEVSTWPEVTYYNIVNYLVIKKSAYTWEDFDAFKSLDSYNYFVSGWVKDVGCFQHNELRIVTARVRHSQSINITPTQPWLIAEKTGRVVAAHCTCVAGLGESCSHIGAVLFTIEATVTQEKAYWMLPHAVDKVQYLQVKDIDFTSAKSKKALFDKSASGLISAKQNPNLHSAPSIPSPSRDELTKSLSELFQSGLKSAVLSLHETFADHFVPAHDVKL